MAGYCSSDSPVVWDVCAKTPTPLQSFVPLAFLGSLGCVFACSRAGTLILYACHCLRSQIRLCRTWQADFRVCMHENRHVCMCFNTRKNSLSAVQPHFLIPIVNLLVRALKTYRGGVEHVQWSPAGTHVVATCRTGLIAIYETRSWTFSRHKYVSSWNLFNTSTCKCTLTRATMQVGCVRVI